MNKRIIYGTAAVGGGLLAAMLPPVLLLGVVAVAGIGAALMPSNTIQR
ncbi:MAG: hypothetical protein RBS40_15775 [Rhodocyclaceae bacterium]|nr:hypothetical protein [Rhodocyclaceae bacterium]